MAFACAKVSRAQRHERHEGAQRDKSSQLLKEAQQNNLPDNLARKVEAKRKANNKQHEVWEPFFDWNARSCPAELQSSEQRHGAGVIPCAMSTRMRRCREEVQNPTIIQNPRGFFSLFPYPNLLRLLQVRENEIIFSYKVASCPSLLC